MSSKIFPFFLIFFLHHLLLNHRRSNFACCQCWCWTAYIVQTSPYTQCALFFALKYNQIAFKKIIRKKKHTNQISDNIIPMDTRDYSENTITIDSMHSTVYSLIFNLDARCVHYVQLCLVLVISCPHTNNVTASIHHMNICIYSQLPFHSTDFIAHIFNNRQPVCMRKSNEKICF